MLSDAFFKYINYKKLNNSANVSYGGHVLHVKPLLLQTPNVFVGFIKNTTAVAQVTFGKNWSTKQTWILSLPLL